MIWILTMTICRFSQAKEGKVKYRDLALSKTEYKGRPTEAIDAFCPCRPCWHPHDFGYLDRQGKWIMRMCCATNCKNGCPPVERRQAVHTFHVEKRKCVHCGTKKPTKKELAAIAKATGELS